MALTNRRIGPDWLPSSAASAAQLLQRQYPKSLSFCEMPHMLASGFPREEYEADIRALEAGTLSPVELKRKLARGLADLYCGEGAGAEAEVAFNRIFVKKDLPEEMPEQALEAGAEAQWLVGILETAGLVKSRGEARRLIKQGAVSVDGKKVAEEEFSLGSKTPREWVVKVGKRRFLKVIAS